MTGSLVVGLATCSDLPDGDEDAAAITAALDAVGISGQWVTWDDPAVAWEELPLVVIRSTWDYTTRRDEFLGWAASLPHLANPAAAVAWSSDKAYLSELSATGIPTVPTLRIAPGESFELPDGELVVKPSVGAGSLGAGRFAANATADARDHVRALHDAGRVALVQPYLSDVDTSGETALLYFDGVFSHAIRKGALLPEGTVHGINRSGLFVEEAISPTEATDAELAVGEQAVAFLRDRFGSDLLYARVDLLPTSDGPLLVELELVEPSLFLDHSPGAADRFAAAVAARFIPRRGGRRSVPQ